MKSSKGVIHERHFFYKSTGNAAHFLQKEHNFGAALVARVPFGHSLTQNYIAIKDDYKPYIDVQNILGLRLKRGIGSTVRVGKHCTGREAPAPLYPRGTMYSVSGIVLQIIGQFYQK